ncbi:penicillin-binding protein activator LpoB [Cyanobacterium stanieri LEGE 03274]|uniref:Penicillin-binding protein activator LpoB n=1 Tax=Cyanobacterium stanieri LEGE 03274 TaxID=1828756 RepID=A0ABR9V6C6_9CHRO|nr:CsgG/HfaB family protein [Cyanobacterium stanieri]MBE9223439.1 penicillin-binding protein activator LpoB [Cyanobacterium stanieri LEGE 03274]
MSITKKRAYKLVPVAIASSLIGASMITTNISPLIAPAHSKPSQNLLAQNNQEKIRLAVMDFDYNSLSNPSYLNLIEGSARGVSEIIVSELVNSGNYRVIERSRIQDILDEQNFGASDRVDNATAAQIGRLLGVELIMVGSITQFDLQDRDTGFGFFGFGFGNQTKKALVTINTRLINTTTGEIMMSAEGKSEVTQVDGQLRVRGVGVGTSTNNDGTLLSVATQDAAKEVINEMNQRQAQLSSIARVNPTTSGLVADVAGNSVIINRGSSHGYRNGLRLSIERVSREIKDPETGEVIRRMTNQLGVIELLNVDSNSSEGRIISGSGFRVGDIASPM